MKPCGLYDVKSVLVWAQTSVVRVYMRFSLLEYMLKSVNMDDSLVDFVTPKRLKKRQPLGELDLNISTVGNDKELDYKRKTSQISSKKNVRVQCAVSVKDQCTQLGTENSISYGKATDQKITYRHLLTSIIFNKDSAVEF